MDIRLHPGRLFTPHGGQCTRPPQRYGYRPYSGPYQKYFAMVSYFEHTRYLPLPGQSWANRKHDIMHKIRSVYWISVSNHWNLRTSKL